METMPNNIFNYKFQKYVEQNNIRIGKNDKEHSIKVDKKWINFDESISFFSALIQERIDRQELLSQSGIERLYNVSATSINRFVEKGLWQRIYIGKCKFYLMK
ncbi:MAG: hypothetical protein IKY94_11595 [Lachnospiraceae bacterium]|jgi:hypothetical protein|nr:hypothetical protein [Lachnospiraceae bacterium]